MLWLCPDKELLLRSQEEVLRLQRRAGRHQDKRDKIDRHNRKLLELLERRSHELQLRLGQLRALRREDILDLRTHIFPMQEEKQGRWVWTPSMHRGGSEVRAPRAVPQ